ncbi:hypothetical protein [Flavobacterium sp. K5-23]|uniref:hypothetical protein n=1 Tax=Flavobacterium sp. K5-23 TaxID=2746225 RepID=UPI00200F3C81|nr:hypothetical protein [Flavobacterium sp. K5-23]UQD56473.1 hypothetical protein FLAK523_08790 [Flavobacterium sp. K5-23]
MKKLILLLCLLSLIACKSKKAKEKIERENMAELLIKAEANEALKAKAYNLGKRVLLTCNTSTFKQFTRDEATDKVIANTTLSRLSKTCAKFRQNYGTFIDLRLIEVIPNEDGQSIIYRFKADYSKKVANKELRVTMDKDNKVSAIVSKDWKDNFEE